MFGGSKTPFGSGGFGSTTSAFGAQQTTPFGGSGGLFGSTPAAGTFGTPTFGSTTPAATGGGLFGGTSTGTSLFGNKTTQSSGFGFGTTGTSSSGGLFGGGGSSLFQTPKTSTAFGAAQKTSGFGGFGATTSNAFGASTGSAFGTTTSAGIGLFGGGGGTTSVFGQQAATSGTTVKFQPVVSSEQTQKSGISMTVKTQNQCITVMDAYKNKSIEELRLEDYSANRKGSAGATSAFGSSSGTATGGLFGASSTGTSLFGSTATAPKPSGFGGFGATSTSGGLFGNTNTSLFGAKTTSSLFGGTTTTTASGFGFGAGATTGGLFGGTSTAGTGLFGSTTTAQPSLFGGATGFGGTSTAGGSLFGNTSTFGQPAVSQSTSLFGAAAKPTAFGGFGASSGTGFGTGTSTFSFGGAANPTAASGGLFGNTQNKSSFNFAAPTSGFGTTTSGFGGFGNTAAPSTLFGGSSTTGGLFGSKPLGFGTSTAGTGSSLFGGAGSTGFGTTQNAGIGLGGLNNINQGTLAALKQQQMIQQQLKAIANTPFGDSPLFRNLPSTTTTKTGQSSTSVNAKELINTSQYKVLSRPAARVKPRPISSPSLGKSRLFDGLGDESDFSPHSLVPRRSVKKLVIKDKGNHQEFESPYESQLKLRSLADDDTDLIAPSPQVVKTRDIDNNESPILPQGISSQPVFESTISELNQKDMQTPVNKKTNNYMITPLSQSATETSLNESNDNDLPPDDGDYELPECKIILRRPEYYTRPTIANLNIQVQNGKCLVRDFTVGREGYGEVRFLGVTDVYALNLDEIVFFRRREVEVYLDNYENKPEVGDELNKPSEITLLKVWPNDKSTHTPVKTPERLKVSGFIERIEEKTMAMDAVFIDYRPKEGAWVFKVNHFTRYGIQEQYIADDANHMKQKMLTKDQAVIEDIDFQREAIKQRLKQHILKRQPEQQQQQQQQINEEDRDCDRDVEQEEDEEDMDDDDDEEVTDESDNITEVEIQYNDKSAADMDEEFLPMSHQLGHVARIEPFNLQGMKTSVLYDDEEYVSSPRSAFKSKQLFSNKSIFSNTYTEPRKAPSLFPKLNISKASQAQQNDTLNSSLFQPVPPDNPLERSSKMAKKAHLFKTGMFQPNVSSLETDKLSHAEVDPNTDNLYVKCRTFEMVPYDKSLMFGKTHLLADTSLVHGREFNTRWSNSLTFVHSGKKIGNVTNKTKTLNPNIFSTTNQQHTALFGFSNMEVQVERVEIDTNEGMKQFIEECLEISLKYTDFEPSDVSTLEQLSLRSGVNALEAYVEVAQAFKQVASGSDVADFKNHSNIWELASALWGKQDIDDSSSLYDVHSIRRESLTKWLSNVSTDDINAEVETNRVQDDGHLAVIFSLLSGNQIEKACQVARDNKEFRLGFLLAQVRGDQHLKHYLRNQLSQWEENNVDKFMNMHRLKIYVLLSGMMVWKSNKNEINLCKNVDWIRCLGLHLWYYCSSTSTIFEAFTEYQHAFKGTNTYDKYAAYPSPEYVEKTTQLEKDKTKDICYHLLALYCNRSHSLEKILTPKTHTTNPLDYHLSWHLQRVLQELGYEHLSDEKHSLLQYSYASQLESIGLWYRAVYVLMHLRDGERREHHVKELLNRYCRVNDDDTIELSDEEHIIVDKFHVPVKWIHEAKALHARYAGEHYKEAIHLIRAYQWNKAHVVILEHLAADAIIEDDHETLKNLLQDISLPDRLCTVKNWRTGGQVFLDYILLYQRLDDIKAGTCIISAYHLEDMEAEVASLINRISIMKVNSSRERLCQSELARNCSNMLKVVFSEMKTQDNDDDYIENEDNPKWSTVKVAPYVVKLPLPPDYYLKELHELVSNFANEIEYESPDYS